MFEQRQWTELETKFLVDSGSSDMQKSIAATHELAKALELPLRQGILAGDITDNIFEPIRLADGASPEFPLDSLAPGTEKDYVAFSIPNHGTLPQRHIEGDYVMIPTYSLGNVIDWLLRYAKYARWDVVGRNMEIFKAGIVKKLNNDAWHTLLASAVDRNIVVFDSDAVQGQFTKRLVSLAKTVMRRNGGGNSTSMNRGQLTDLFLSPEGMEDIRNWNVDQVDEITRREIFLASENGVNRIFNVNLHDLDELGVGQEFQLYYANELAGTLPSGDEEIAVGLDLRRRDSFVMPIRQELEIFEDPFLHKQQRAGWYGWMECGFGALDNRRTMLLSY